MDNQTHRSIIDFKTEFYFPSTVIFLGACLLFAGFLVVLSKLIVGIGLLLTGLIIVTTHHRLCLDLTTKTYHDYLWVVGLKMGDKQRFENIDYIFINKNKVSQTMQLRVVSSVIKKDVYDAYLRFSESNKIHLIRMDGKDALMKKLEWLAKTLRVKLVDNTGEAVEEIQ